MANILAELVGEVLDNKYLINKQLGQGGMGAVYLAAHMGTKRPVALKVITPQFMTNAEFVERFRREAEAAGRLRHPNVVNVTDFGFADHNSQKLAYLVMEFLDGCTLRDVIEEEKALPLPWIVDIVDQVCSAIGEAHDHGIVHRDLKPDNIWLEPNRRGGYTVKVLDFGLAKLRGGDADSNEASNKAPVTGRLKPPAELETAATVAQMNSAEAAFQSHLSTLVSDGARTDPIEALNTEGGDASNTEAAGGELTRAGSILGTPLYMSPEQSKGASLDARSDIYSLGVIVYQMIAGRTPFTGNMFSLIVQHTENSPPPLKGLLYEVPKPVEEIVMSALAKSPDERPQTADSFASAFRARAEGASMILRQSISLYGDHLPTFLKISLITHAPMIVSVALLILQDLLADIGVIPPRIADILAPTLFTIFGIANLFANVINLGVFVPVVAQLLVAPLRKVDIEHPFAGLINRARPFIKTVFWYYASILPMAALFLIPSVFVYDLPYKWLLAAALLAISTLGIKPYINNCLFASVAIMEEHEGRGALTRSKALTARLYNVAFIIVIAQTVIFVYLSYKFASCMKEDSLVAAHIFMTALGAFTTTILTKPLFAILTALLYLKTRQASGETLKEALGRFNQENDASKWIAKMRERIASLRSLPGN